MDSDVKYTLDTTLKNEIGRIKNLIQTYLQDADIFLFGSIAKGCYSKQSDIDLLILISENKTTKELRFLRHELEDAIEEVAFTRKVDIKLYNVERYKELCKQPCFENVIQQDLINLKSW